VLLSLLASACFSEPPPPPASINMVQRPVLVVNAGSTPSRPESVQVFVHPEQQGGCLVIPTLKASVDGVVLTQLHGKVDQNGYRYDRDCDVYEFVLQGQAPPPKDLSVVEVTDGTITMRAEVANLLSPRRLQVHGGPYKRGDEVRLGWTPPGDTVAPDGDLGVELRAGEASHFLGKTAVHLVGDELVFTLPEDLPPAFTGPVEVEFRGTMAVQPTVKTCTWAVACQVSRTYVVDPVTVQVR
jgi:hypothetical protein